jgi:hypothetical protein
MPNYLADPDIREVLESRFEIPDDLDQLETERLQEFLRCDQVLEAFYRRNPATVRPPENELRAAAATAMAAYDNRSPRLSVGWQKFLVLQAGVAGSQDNLDSYEVQDWAYTRIKEENPDWLGDFDEDVDLEKPLRWVTQLIGVRVLMARDSKPASPPPPRKRWFAR